MEYWLWVGSAVLCVGNVMRFSLESSGRQRNSATRKRDRGNGKQCR